MKTNYYVVNEINGLSYGPFNFYDTASRVADKIDDNYGACVARIKLDLMNQLISLKHVVH